MRRRILAATAGGVVAGGLLALVLATWSAPSPRGVVLVVLVLGVLVPGSTAVGTAAGLRAAREDRLADAGRLAAIGAPLLVLLVLFTVDVADPAPAGGPLQLASIVLGSAGAAAFAARFTGPPVPGEED